MGGCLVRAELRGPTLPCGVRHFFPSPAPLCHRLGIPGQLLGQPVEGDSPGTLQGGRLGPASTSLRAAATEKKGIRGRLYFLGSTECWEMFPGSSWAMGVDPCREQEGCAAAGAGGVFCIHLSWELFAAGLHAPCSVGSRGGWELRALAFV